MNLSVLKRAPISNTPATRRLLVALGCVICILLVDIETPSDNVSIGFAYTLPILVSVYAGRRSAYMLAAVSTVATIIGGLVQPPHEGIVPTFVANRVIAVTAQWLVAFLIEQRRRTSAVIRAHLADERRKAETRHRFMQILSHEAGSALTSIAGQSYRLAKLADAISPEDIVTRAAKIQRAVTRLDALVVRIRLASEVGQGEFVLNPEPIDVTPFLVALCGEFEGEANIRLENHDELVIHGDRDILHQAIANVISNAVKYSKQNEEIAVSVQRSAILDGVSVAVADHGSGIQPEELHKVFEPYYRGTNSGGVPGIGIGLHLVRHFVEAHGGEVRITSRVGLGTTVIIHLPMERKTEGRPA